ncbi:N-acyl-D-amino-acid deacylase family protein [Steroidobacter sp.]|uniref:N-acyl-D-amino-acid deacylase family protein n=1 Tax=Steroidobacter sp. TaxID=1978227 RepID=UPI0025E92EDB|nr:D-aminoacylase [Steroidobacter sp.]
MTVGSRRPWARRSLLALSIAAIAMGTASCSSKKEPAFDLLVAGGTIYDGSGGEPFVGDVGVKGDRIVYVGPKAEGGAKQTIQAQGKAVSPGFINAMSHATYSLLTDRSAESDLRQGVTLEVMGEGGSPGPLTEEMAAKQQEDDEEGKPPFQWRTFGQYMEGVEKLGVSVNFAGWVGATTVRQHVLGVENVKPTPEQLQQMGQLVRGAMEEGALGLSTALIYLPGLFANVDELSALAAESGKCGGMYVSHMRSEGDHFIEALDELIEIARRSQAPAEVFHIKVGDPKNWPKMAVALEKIREARKQGVRITADMYTYPASGTGMTASMPPWVQEGGPEKFRARLKDPKIRARVIAEMREPVTDWENVMRGAGGPKGVMLASFKNDKLKPLIGKTLAEVAEMRGVSAEEAALQLIEEDETRVGVFYFTMSEDNLKVQIQEPYVSFGSDAPALTAAGETLKTGTHPRAYGTFARVFAKFVREDKLLTVQEAVRRLTSLPAANYSLTDRGSLKAGYFADIVVFDPATIQDHATYVDPHRYSTGVSDVVVNGVAALANGEPTEARPGRYIRGRAWKGQEGGGCKASASEWSWIG